MPPTSTFHQESAGFWSVSWQNTSGEDGQRTISLRCRPAKNGDNSIRQSTWVIWCSFEASLRLQQSGSSPASPLFIQGVMESLAWSICVRPPQLFVAPSPRSLVFIMLNKDHSPVWRRWAECSGFNLYPRRREHSPTPATHTCVRESCANQRSPRVSLRSPYYKARRRHIATPAGASSTRDGRETTAIHYKPRGTA